VHQKRWVGRTVTPKLPKLTAAEAEKLLLQAGFKLIRSKGSYLLLWVKGNLNQMERKKS